VWGATQGEVWLTAAFADPDGDGVDDVFVGVDGDRRVYEHDAQTPATGALADPTLVVADLADGDAVPLRMAGGSLAVLEQARVEPGAIHFVEASPPGSAVAALIDTQTLSMPERSPLRGRDLFAVELASGPGTLVVGEGSEAGEHGYVHRTAWVWPADELGLGAVADIATGATSLQGYEMRDQHESWDEPAARCGDFEGDGLTDIVQHAWWDPRHPRFGHAVATFAGPRDRDRDFSEADAGRWYMYAFELGEVADLDGDSLDDVTILTDYGPATGGYSAVDVNHGPLRDLDDEDAWETLIQADFDPASADAPAPHSIGSLISPDVDGDGQPDLVTASEGAVRIYLGPFTELRTIDDTDVTIPSPCFGGRSQVVAGEADGDPEAELAVTIGSDLRCGERDISNIGVALFLDPLAFGR